MSAQVRDRRDGRLPNRARRRLRSFNQKWGDVVQVVVGTLVVALAAVVVLIALEIRSSSRDTEVTARVSCERARQFGPALADFYDRQGAFEGLTPPVRAFYLREEIPLPTPKLYLATIPETCP